LLRPEPAESAFATAAAQCPQRQRLLVADRRMFFKIGDRGRPVGYGTNIDQPQVMKRLQLFDQWASNTTGCSCNDYAHWV
jgi:hypothetical protein